VNSRVIRRPSSVTNIRFSPRLPSRLAFSGGKGFCAFYRKVNTAAEPDIAHHRQAATLIRPVYWQAGIIRQVIALIGRFWRSWRKRHRSGLSVLLHAVGIPLVVLALLLAGWQLLRWRWDLWWRPALLLFAGYVLQFAGHWHEQNDPGEVILFKRLLGRPYVAVSPRYGTSAENKGHALSRRGQGSTSSVPLDHRGQER